MTCAESPRIHALVDGELGAGDVAALERHLEGCAECRDLLAATRRLRAAVRAGAARHAAGPALRARLAAALDAEPGATRPGAGRPRPMWRGAPFWAGAGGGALAAGVAALAIVVAIGAGQPMRPSTSRHGAPAALVSGHAIDVESTRPAHRQAVVRRPRRRRRRRSRTSPPRASCSPAGASTRRRHPRRGRRLPPRRAPHQRVRVARRRRPRTRAGADAQRLPPALLDAPATSRTAPCRIPAGPSSSGSRA